MDSETLSRLQEALGNRRNGGSGDRVVDVLTEARNLDVDGMSRAEIAFVLGLKNDHTGTLLRRAVTGGTVEYIGKRPVENIVGSTTQVPFYGLANYVPYVESDS